MKRSNYKYIVVDGVITIIDNNTGYESVTNDIKNVILDIERIEGIDAQEYKVIYRDSELTWDGWDTKEKQFILLNATGQLHALLKLEEYYK